MGGFSADASSPLLYENSKYIVRTFILTPGSSFRRKGASRKKKKGAINSCLLDGYLLRGILRSYLVERESTRIIAGLKIVLFNIKRAIKIIVSLPRIITEEESISHNTFSATAIVDYISYIIPQLLPINRSD